MTFLILFVCFYLAGCATAATFRDAWTDDEPIDYFDPSAVVDTRWDDER